MLFLSVTMRFRFRVIVVHLEFQFSLSGAHSMRKAGSGAVLRLQKYSFSGELTSVTGI